MSKRQRHKAEGKVIQFPDFRTHILRRKRKKQQRKIWALIVLGYISLIVLIVIKLGNK